MIEILIPGYRKVQLKYLVMDYNGTMACDGNLIKGLEKILEELSSKLEIHVLTADTFGKAKEELKKIPSLLSILPEDKQDEGKLEYVKNLGAKFSVCIGNGRNDRLMLKHSELGIALIQEEGASAATIMSADIVCKDILSALKLLTIPKRLIATLRS